jgi:hypothetical protein
VIDARTIQNLIDREDAKQRATPVLTDAQLQAIIHPSVPTPSDPAADAVAVANEAIRQAYARGTREGATAGIAAGRAVEQVFARRRR